MKTTNMNPWAVDDKYIMQRIAEIRKVEDEPKWMPPATLISVAVAFPTLLYIADAIRAFLVA